MLERVAVSMWGEVVAVPATLNAEGDLQYLSTESQLNWSDAYRPWVAEATEREKANKDRAIAQQWSALYGAGAENKQNKVLEAIRRQQRRISGLDQ